MAPSLVITEVNDEIIRQLMETKNCRVDIRPIFEAAKLKKGEDKLNNILDIEFVIATAYNSHCDNDDRWKLWISFTMALVIPGLITLGVLFLKHLVP